MKPLSTERLKELEADDRVNMEYAIDAARRNGNAQLVTWLTELVVKRAAIKEMDRKYIELMDTIEILSDPNAMEMLAKSVRDIRDGRLHDHAEVEKEMG